MNTLMSLSKCHQGSVEYMICSGVLDSGRRFSSQVKIQTVRLGKFPRHWPPRWREKNLEAVILVEDPPDCTSGVLRKSVWWPTKSSRPHNHFLLGARFACHEPKMATGHLSSHRKRSSSYASLAFFPNLFCQPIQSIRHDPPVRN